MVEWLFSGVGATLLSDWLKERRSRKQKPPCAPSVQALEMQGSSYALSVGEKIKFIRTDLLNMSLRQLSELLEIEKVSNLEKYELGIEEFPLPFLKKFETYFSVRSEYLDGRSESIFAGFHLCKAEVEDYLLRGYSPVVLCSPDERSELFCRIAFEKNEGAFPQVVIGDLLCSFASTGGGKMNIQILIHALLRRGDSHKAVRVLKVTGRAWELMRRGAYYTQDNFHRSADWECQEVFVKWFKESEESNRRWNSRLIGESN